MDEMSSQDYERLVDEFTKRAVDDFRRAGHGVVRAAERPAPMAWLTFGTLGGSTRYDT